MSNHDKAKYTILATDRLLPVEIWGSMKDISPGS